MSLMSDAVQPFLVSGLISLSGRPAATSVADLIGKQGTIGFDLDINDSNQTFTADFRTRDPIVNSIAHDSSRFAAAAFQSMILVCEDVGAKEGTAWGLIRAYYAAFYAGHSTLRLLGDSCIYLNRLHIAQITSLLQASGKIPAFRIRASAYHCKNEGDAKLTSKSLRDGGGGAHEAFWDVFGMRLRQISEGVLLGPLDQASAQSVFAKLDSLQQSLRAKGAPLHSWLSVTRNELQYRHGYGVWLPGSLRRQDRERLSRVFGQWRRDPMDIDIGAVRDQPLDEFAVTCAFIVALCRTLLVRIGDRAEAGGRSFAKLGPLAVLRETERPLSDRQG